MADFTAQDVKKLRDATGAGMMDAKKALTETDGDFDKAIELLRVKGQAKAKSRGEEREATAGLVASAGGALVELKSETDFVAKNEEFVATAQQIAEAADAAKAGDLDAVKAVTLGDSTVGEVVERHSASHLPTLARADCRAAFLVAVTTGVRTSTNESNAARIEGVNLPSRLARRPGTTDIRRRR